MLSTSALVNELSYSLQGELNNRLAPGEELVVSLPGSFGEALAVTNRRAIILRERNSGSGIEAFVHPRTSIAGASAVSSTTGGYIELKLAEPPKEEDEARVYFPSYDLSKFQAAAEAIATAKAPAAVPASAPSPAPGVSIPSPGPTCPGCGAAAQDSDVFCAACGRQLKTICAWCQSGVPMGSAFCRSCGMKMSEFVPACRNCGGRIQRWMTFCPECGSVQGAKCAACSMGIVEGMRYCPSCGRQPGSDKVEPSALRRARATLSEASLAGDEPVNIPEPPVPAAVSFTAPTTAEEHNQRGQQLFEQELFDEAIAEFEQAVRMEPLNGSYHCNLAVACDEAERDDDALPEYERALELDPNDLTALLSLGYLYSEQDDADKARETWSKILVIAPDSPEAQEARDNLKAQEQL